MGCPYKTGKKKGHRLGYLHDCSSHAPCFMDSWAEYDRRICKSIKLEPLEQIEPMTSHLQVLNKFCLIQWHQGHSPIPGKNCSSEEKILSLKIARHKQPSHNLKWVSERRKYIYTTTVLQDDQFGTSLSVNCVANFWTIRMFSVVKDVQYHLHTKYIPKTD